MAFSQKAEPITVGSATYAYGVTSDKYLAAADLWTVEPTGEEEIFEVNGLNVNIPTFYLKDSNGKYLGIKLKDGSSDTYELVTVELNDNTKPTVFSYNTLGELNTSSSPGLRVVIYEDGTYALVKGREMIANEDNVKVYAQEANDNGKKYMITNMLQLYEMPEAGGSGVRSYMLVGSAISGAVFVVMLRTVTRRHRKWE
ncbi:MAG: hypothetical protein LUC50_07440 [Ruminococcus sp.]|nr:hypothetical protein [Ruminococcus sp.]